MSGFDRLAIHDLADRDTDLRNANHLFAKKAALK